MAEFPALPLWTDAYLADTMDLTLEEHGAYLKLIILAWRTPDCTLPDDDKRLAAMLGVGPRTWQRLRAAVLDRFWTRREVESSGTRRVEYFQKRLAREHERSRVFRQAQSERAKSRKHNNSHHAGASSRHKSGTPPGNAGEHANPSPSPKEYTPRPSLMAAREATKLGQIVKRVLEIAGLEGQPVNTSFVQAWINAGADPDDHVYPTVERITASIRARGDAPRTLKLFDRDVMAAITAKPNGNRLRDFASEERETERLHAELRSKGLSSEEIARRCKAGETFQSMLEGLNR